MTEKPKKIKSFFREVKTEMKKVNWPTKEETIKYTIVVVGTTFVVAVYLGALDAALFSILRNFVI